MSTEQYIHNLLPTLDKAALIRLIHKAADYLEEKPGDINEERRAYLKTYLITATPEEAEYLKRNGITRQEAAAYEAQIEKIKNGTYDASEYEDWKDVRKELDELI